MKRTRVISYSIAIVILLILAVVYFGNRKNATQKDAFQSELKTKGKLTIGLEGTYAPYSYRKNGKLTGFEVEMGRAVAKKMGVKADFVPTKWDSLVAGLGSQKYDVVINNISETPARKKVYKFSNPYIYSRYALITQKNSQISHLKDISGKKFAEGTGTNNEQVAKKYHAKLVSSGDFSTTLSLLRTGRADGTINAAEAWYAYKKDNATDGLEYKDLSSEIDPVKVSAMFNKKDPKTRAKFNKALAAIRKDGTLKKLSIKYFGADITKENN
ncbi:transporter substrate-binding domain-containing protein [Weissella paramesenteroides]|uniref:transporter substrate-binding domain-containing protein n=1 Tax=Weissella paramesenteroides TaxID=1249 RepID=UPI00123B6169|nr:transporter substrate-binding domain-containing protein [Weissella paramesenteroides]KAA8459200.1 transporter substrate-binding domain-containing protein [Weissella paramesenteroides]